MIKDRIEFLVKTAELRQRLPDRERVKSILKSAETNAAVVSKIPMAEDSATVIFREMYESIRQLGDAHWWLLGYEPLNHEVCLEILKEADIRGKVKLNHLARFKKIRNDINYRGFRASVMQAQEIIDFWSTCGKEMLDILKKRAK